MQNVFCQTKLMHKNQTNTDKIALIEHKASHGVKHSASVVSKPSIHEILNFEFDFEFVFP